MASEVVAPDISLIGSLRLVSGTLSRELNLTRELDRELRSGLVSDIPGISSIFVGVTMNRTEAILVVVSGGCIFLFLYKGKEKPRKIFPPTLAAFDRKNRKLKKTLIILIYTTQTAPNKNPYIQNSSSVLESALPVAEKYLRKNKTKRCLSPVTSFLQNEELSSSLS